MTSTRLSSFRATLERHQAELLEGGRNREAIAIDSSPDELDRIQHARDRDQSIDSMERQAHRLRDVRSALLRVAAGEFGICVGCEEEISLRRLDALPWAVCCIQCQETMERELEAPAEEFAPAMAGAH